ncbi:ABC family transporter: mitochondrial ATM1-like protein [Scenedesmus sp. NREL 46B-D3]|nr:ABC family transporter: mitochondrial ATM1-like protein [Scenedesmus sp. NREL 46B-D3]
MLASKAAGLSGPLFLKAAVDTLSAGGAAVLLPAVRCVLCFGLCGIIQHLTKELTYPIFTPISQAVARRVAYQTFSHVLELDITFHMNRRTGRLSRILERGTRSIQMLYRAVLFTFAPTFIELVFVVGLLATRFSPMVALLVGGTFAVYVAWTLAMTQAAVEVRKQVNQLDNLTTSKAVDALLNAETVALFNNRQLEVNQYDHYLRGYQAAAIQTERLSALLNAGQSVILSAGLTCVMVAAVIGGQGEAAVAAAAATGGSMMASAASAVMGRGSGGAAAGAAGAAGAGVSGALASPGDLVLLQGLLLQLWGPLHWFLGWFYREIRQSLVDMEEVLKGVSVKVLPGESVAVVGPSGSGKSTILKLATRLYEAGSGTIKVNGVDVRELQTASLRKSVAVVPQDTVLFNDTILQNIRYGKPNATDEEVIAAARMAHLHEAVLRMPDGYATMVGERGLKLSGGEKQRVAIARAFLRAPRLLICDEATSALDTATEASILGSLNELARGRTSIFVAHRLSTVAGCDRILVLSEGRLVEQGSHAQLLAAGGVYKDMWIRQAAEGSSGKGEVSTDEESAEGDPLEPLPAALSRTRKE